MVKTRGRRERGAIPPLFLFTDHRVADPVASVRALATLRPRKLCAVILRGGDRASLGACLAPLCRQAGIPLLVAGDVRLAHALRAGLHLSSARRPTARIARHRLLSASVHNAAQLRRARRAGAGLIFLAPVFPTESHIGARTLGPLSVASLARAAAGARLYALGGVDGRTVRRLSTRFTGAGAITALAS